MRAIVYETYGPPEVLQLKEIEIPSPSDDELLIKVLATKATKSDCELRSFNFPVKWFSLPLRIAMGIRKPKRQVLGGYFAGEVEAVGKEVSKFAAGDQVFGTGAQVRCIRGVHVPAGEQHYCTNANEHELCRSSSNAFGGT